MDPLSWIDDQLQSLEQQQLRRHLATRTGPQDAHQILLDDQVLVNFASNDYLGFAAELAELSADPDWLVDGRGSGASPLVTGRAELHEQLECQLARFERTEAAILFPSGYAANTGTIPALVGPGDVIFSDAKNHASIIDGCRLSGASLAIYRHLDHQHAGELLDQQATARRRLIVTDSLFSMDGDLAPLQQLADLAEQYDAMLMVDEAHATGILGPSGRGACELAGVTDRVHIKVGTLSKALGCSGGFVAGSAMLIQWLANTARSYVFSTAPPAPLAAAALCALRWIDEFPHRRHQVLENARQLRQQLSLQGWEVSSQPTQVIALPIGDPGQALQLARELSRQGLLVAAIRPPSVPEGESLLRISIGHHHQPADLDQLVAALQACRSQLV
ncbi:MAG: 8-amino-7-oxononanoate synthase [Pirellulaceae bacterium]